MKFCPPVQQKLAIKYNSLLLCATSVSSHILLHSSDLSIRAKGVGLPSIFSTLRDVSLLINCCLIAAVAAPC